MTMNDRYNTHTQSEIEQQVEQPAVQYSLDGLEFEIPTRDFVIALEITSAIIERRSGAGSLNDIKIEARGNTLVFTATNDTILIEYMTGADIKSGGMMIVDVSILSSIVKKIVDQKIFVTVTDGSIALKTTTCDFRVHGAAVEQFASFVMVDNVISEFEIPVIEFLTLIKYCEFSMLCNDTRYNLNGIHIQCDNIDNNDNNNMGFGNNGSNHTITAVSTDGHRLSVIHRPISQVTGLFSVTLPMKTVRQLYNIYQSPNLIQQTANVKITKNKFQITTDHLKISSKLLNAAFPEYKNLIPQAGTNVLKIQGKILFDTIERISVISSDVFRGIKLTLANKEIIISAYSDIKGCAQETISCTSDIDQLCQYNGEFIEIGFNARYLLDILHHAKASIVILQMNTNVDPVVCSIDKLDSAQFVVMPVKI